MLRTEGQANKAKIKLSQKLKKSVNYEDHWNKENINSNHLSRNEYIRSRVDIKTPTFSNDSSTKSASFDKDDLKAKTQQLESLVQNMKCDISTTFRQKGTISMNFRKLEMQFF